MRNLLKLFAYVGILSLHLFSCFSNSNETNEEQKSKTENINYEVEHAKVESSKEYMPNDTAPKMSSYETKKSHIEQRKTAEKNYIIDYDYVFEGAKNHSPLPVSQVKTLKIEEKTKPWHDDFEYFILDTLELKTGITTFLVIQYYDSESMGFLFNFKDTAFIDMLKVFYDNDEGCWSDNSVIFETNLIYIENYDCSKDDQKEEQENFWYIITDNGKFEEVFIETT